MGSGSSRLGPRVSRPRVNRSKLKFLICGGSTSRATHEMEDYLAEIAECRYPDPINVQTAADGSSLIPSGRMDTSSANTDSRTSSESSITATDDTSVEDGQDIVRNHGQQVSECEELVQVRVVESHDESHRDTCATASTSFKEQQSSDPVYTSNLPNKDAVNGIGSSVNVDVRQPQTEAPHGIISVPEEEGVLNLSGSSDSQADEVTTTSGSHSASRASDLPVTFESLGDESILEAMPSGIGFLVANRERGQEDGGVLHVNLVTLSSFPRSGPDARYREARRNGRRLFWDAFSRRNARSESSYSGPTAAFSMNEADEMGSHDRWILDVGGDIFLDELRGGPRHIGSRIQSLNDRRRHSRSEIWERIQSDLNENGRRNSSCPAGLHPDGSCSCESFFMAESSGTRASISRIIMLAEALFEVLNEIHSQPLSFALSMISPPAPESVVDSFPIKNHKKEDSAEGGDDSEQCHICLCEYEEGDKIRVLPCHHEYHMSCVDKWLKEIHGICPLCRGDVREGCSVTNPDTPSS